MIEGGIVTFYIEDMEQSIDFYTEALGLTLIERFADHYALVDAGAGLMLGLRMTSERSPPSGKVGSITVGFHVTKPLETVKEHLEDEGVEFLTGILEGPGGAVRMAFIKDPDGNRLYLIEPRSSQE